MNEVNGARPGFWSKTAGFWSKSCVNRVWITTAGPPGPDLAAGPAAAQKCTRKSYLIILKDIQIIE